MTHRFSFPTEIRFGAGVLAELGEAVDRHMRRVLLVTDTGLARLPILGRVQQALGTRLTATYAEVEGNPTEMHVLAGVEAYRAGGCDGVVGLGGGSALDVAKAVALMATHEGSVFDYDDALGGYERIRTDVAPTVAIPTTAGTGSEVGRSAVIANPSTLKKVVVFGPPLLPKVALVDPELMVGLPPAVTAATGMDALTHNVEAFLAKGFHPLCDGIALEGIYLAGQHLRRAVENGEDLEARGGMAMSSLMGAVAFQKGLGATHSLAHPLSSVSGLHHGLANGILLASVMRFNADAARDRMARIGRVLGGQGTETDLVRGAIRFVEELSQVIGIPRSLKDAGVDPADLDRLADLAIEDGCHQSNPRPVTRDDLRRLYEESLNA